MSVNKKTTAVYRTTADYRNEIEQREVYNEIALRNALYDADAVTMQGVKIINQFSAVDAVEVVRCEDCVHAVEIEKDYVRKLFVDGTKQCELGRADTVFGYSIISNDGFCDSGERKKDGH